MDPEAGRVEIELTKRQRRLIETFLILATIALAFVVLGYLDAAFRAFQDLIILFFLAWLLSFALLPLINLVQRLMPGAPGWLPVIIVYSAVVLIFLGILIQLAATLANSIAQFIRDSPALETQLRLLLAEVQRRLAGFGYQVELEAQAPTIIATLNRYAQELVGPLQQFALASIGALGSLLILVMTSLYIALDRSAILAFLFRLVPPSFVREAHLLQAAVSRSFGGFIRGQLLMGLIYGLVGAVTNLVLALPYAAATAVAAGVLHAIPFFGPFVSWAPPVVVALLLQPGDAVPAFVFMAIGWFVVMNLIGPRLMGGTVGIHPIVVLASALIGAKIAGIMGAIFGIPIAAVISAFFFHFYARSREAGTVADRATVRVAAREGREIRRPREPVGGVDQDVAEVGGRTAAPADPAMASGHPGEVREADRRPSRLEGEAHG